MRKIMGYRSLIIACAVLLAPLAESSSVGKTEWACTDFVHVDRGIILRLAKTGFEGRVEVFDDVIDASYRLNGIQKRWDWGVDSSGGAFNYSIVLGPDGIASFYDFTASSTVKPSELFKCRRIK